MSDTGQVVIDGHGNIAGVDYGFCSLVRRSADDLVGRNILEITAAGDRRECELALAEMVETGRQVYATKRYLCGDGTIVWAEATAALILRSDLPGCAVLHAEAITDRQPSEHPARLLQAARIMRGQYAARTDVVDSALLAAWGAIIAAYIAEAEGRLFPAASNDLFGFANAESVAR